MIVSSSVGRLYGFTVYVVRPPSATDSEERTVNRVGGSSTVVMSTVVGTRCQQARLYWDHHRDQDSLRPWFPQLSISWLMAVLVNRSYVVVCVRSGAHGHTLRVGPNCSPKKSGSSPLLLFTVMPVASSGTFTLIFTLRFG